MGPPCAKNDAIGLEHCAIPEIDVVTVCERADVGPMDGAIAVVKNLPEVGNTCKAETRIAPEDSVRSHQQG